MRDMQVSEHNSLPDSEMSSVKPACFTQQLFFTLPFVLSHKLINTGALFVATNALMIQENKVSFKLRMFQVNWPIKSVDAKPCHKAK